MKRLAVLALLLWIATSLGGCCSFYCVLAKKEPAAQTPAQGTPTPGKNPLGTVDKPAGKSQ